MKANSQVHVGAIMNPARRRFLLSTLLGLLAGRALTACDTSVPPGAGVEQTPSWLAKITGDPDAVARIGKRYLAAYPQEQEPAVLLSAIEREVAAQPGVDDGDSARMVTALQQVVRDEYRRNAVVKLDGWILSRTEARLYAAATLLPN